MSKPMDLNTLSRKELQALCKSNGIPANKTNAFMMEALAKRRVPLSQVDGNRDQRFGNVIGSPFRPPPLVRKNNTGANGTEPVRKPFTNNFLTRGKRKDAPTSSYESDHEEKQKVRRIEASSGPRKSSNDLSQRSAGCAAPVKSVQPEAVAQSLRPDRKVSTKAKLDTGLKPGVCHGISAKQAKGQTLSGIAATEANVIASGETSSNELTSYAKGQIDDRVRSQIDAALCSKVMKAPEKRPSAQTLAESSEGPLLPEVKIDNSAALNLPLDNAEEQMESAHVMEESHLPPEHQLVEICSSPDPPVCQIVVRREDRVSASTPARQLSASLELIEASPPLRFSPLVVLEDKVRSIVDRVQNFWKSRDLVVADRFGSPVL